MTISLDTFRLFLHVFAAAIWVGGQITLAGLVGTIRKADSDLPKQVARQFSRIEWPAFAVLFLTGLWNLAEASGFQESSYMIALFVKLLSVALAGISVFLHTRAKTTAGLAFWGALGALSSVAALFFGIVLHG